MKGGNAIEIPGELYAPTKNGVVVSAEGVKDYRQGKNQETINADLLDKVDNALEIAEDVKQTNDLTANVAAILLEHGDEGQTLKDILDLNSVVGQNTSAISLLQAQLNSYNIVVLTEEEYDALEETDNNTLYFIEEVD